MHYGLEVHLTGRMIPTIVFNTHFAEINGPYFNGRVQLFKCFYCTLIMDIHHRPVSECHQEICGHLCSTGQNCEALSTHQLEENIINNYRVGTSKVGSFKLKHLFSST